MISLQYFFSSDALLAANNLAEIPAAFWLHGQWTYDTLSAIVAEGICRQQGRGWCGGEDVSEEVLNRMANFWVV